MKDNFVAIQCNVKEIINDEGLGVKIGDWNGYEAALEDGVQYYAVRLSDEAINESKKFLLYYFDNHGNKELTRLLNWSCASDNRPFADCSLFQYAFENHLIKNFVSNTLFKFEHMLNLAREDKSTCRTLYFYNNYITLFPSKTQAQYFANLLNEQLYKNRSSLANFEFYKNYRYYKYRILGM